MEESKRVIELAGQISVGITHVHGKILFKNPDIKWSRVYYSVCHFSECVYAMTPEDYLRPTMVTTIKVVPSLPYCDKAKICLHFKCDLNRFDREEYIKQFSGDFGSFTLGMPKDFGTKDIWFNEGKWKEMWKNYIIPVDGGVLKFNEHAT